MSVSEEARQLLQSRTTVLFKLMFWSFGALLVYVGLLYTIFPEKAPRYRDWVYAGSALGILAMGITWRVVLVRRQLSLRALRGLDIAYSIITGLSFGASAFVQYDLRPAGYMALIFAGATVFSRALILPSSTKRTLILSTLTFVPMTAAAAALSLTATEEMPGPAFFLGYVVLSTAPIALATVGSSIIYDLRRQISTAHQVGQYTLEQKIGEGGMGKVYRARHALLRRPTAVKLLPLERFSGESLIRFEREVQTLSQLSHPNTVAVFDYGRSADGVFYYAMEYLGGGVDLERLVRRYGRQPGARVARILIQACGALQEAHDRGVIHRDVKPPNIILCERGGLADVVKVVDFGLVKHLRTEQTDTMKTAQIILGTPHYIAPEAVVDGEHISPAADIYALGCVAYFLLTGKRLFEGTKPLDICIQHVTKTPTPPSQHVPELSPELEAIVLRCLAKDPTARFASAAALGAALRELPIAGWSDSDARAWWHTHRQTPAITPESGEETRTIRIDLGTREIEDFA